MNAFGVEHPISKAAPYPKGSWDKAVEIGRIHQPRQSASFSRLKVGELKIPKKGKGKPYTIKPRKLRMRTVEPDFKKLKQADTGAYGRYNNPTRRPPISRVFLPGPAPAAKQRVVQTTNGKLRSVGEYDVNFQGQWIDPTTRNR